MSEDKPVPNYEEFPDTRTEPLYDHVSYLRNLLRPDKIQRTIRNATIVLARYDFQFDAFAVRGISGTLLGAHLSLAMSKYLNVVRKSDMDSHSYRWVEGNRNTRKYIILDDCVASGNTVYQIVSHMKKFAPHAVCLGVLECGNIDEYSEENLYRHDLTRIDNIIERARRRIEIEEFETRKREQQLATIIP